MSEIIYCADVIARHAPTGTLVLVERLGSMKGLAFPGGKHERGELLSETARREFFEETGLSLVIHGVLATCAQPGRDARGHYVSTVFLGEASGMPRDEEHKTRVLLLTEEEALARKNDFAFDHFDLLVQYRTNR